MIDTPVRVTAEYIKLMALDDQLGFSDNWTLERAKAAKCVGQNKEAPEFKLL